MPMSRIHQVENPKMKQSRNYREDIVMLNSLVVSTRLDILPAVHQYVMFLEIPKLSYKTYSKVFKMYQKYRADSETTYIRRCTMLCGC